MNLYSLSGLLIAVTSGLMTTLMLFIGKKKLHYLWGVFCFCVFIFGLGVYFVGGSTTPDVAAFWWRFAHIGAILIPVLFLHFACEFLGIKRTGLLILLYIISILLLAANFTDGIFISNMRFVFDQFYYDSPPAPFYPLFTMMFFGLTAYSHYLLWNGLKKCKDKLIREKIKFFLFGMAVSFAGGAFNFLPVYGIDIYPYLNLTVALYPLIITYAIFRHQLFDIKLILVEFAVLALNLFLFLNVLSSNSSPSRLLDILISILVFMFSIVLLRGIYKDILYKDRIGVLVKEKEVSNEKLRKLDEQKTEFISIASHQLRTPLTVIKGYGSMILEGTFGGINDSARNAMENIYVSSEKVASLVEEMLTVSRIEQKRVILNYEITNLNALVQDAINDMKDEILDAQINLSFVAIGGRSYYASVDTVKFRSVLVHILDNAIKFTPPNGSVKVEIGDDDSENNVRISVSDTGVGMSAEQIADILSKPNINTEQFNGNMKDEQALADDSSGASRIGNVTTTGIGLYIAQEVVNAHNGVIRIQSRGKNQGTTVVVDIPETSPGK